MRYSAKNPISREQIQTIAPAVFALNPANHVSNEYKFVDTGNIYDTLASKGWECIAASQQKVRNADKREGTKHCLVMKPSAWEVSKTELGGLYPMLKIINSHDWSSRLILSMGMMRLVCGNGLTIEGAMFKAFSLRHDNVPEDLAEVLDRFQSYVAHMMTFAQRWDTIQLSVDQIVELGIACARIRFGDESDKLSLQGQALSLARRHDDTGNSLWRVYNRIQENAIKGGMKVNGMQRRIRELSNIQAEHDVNKGIFQLSSFYDPEMAR